MANLKTTILGYHPTQYFRMDDPSGSILTDISGNGNNGTITAPLTLGAKGGLIKDANTAVQNDGTGEAHSPNFTAAEYTVLFWARFPAVTSGSSQFGLVGRRFPTNDGNDFLIHAVIGPAGSTIDYTASVFDGTTNNQVVSVPEAPNPTGQWMMLAMTVSSDTLTFYINGVSQGSTSTAGSSNLGQPTEIMSNLGFSDLIGFLDELAIIPSALGPSDITAIYAAGAPLGYYPAAVLALSPVGYYRSNDSLFGASNNFCVANTTAFDSSTFANAGTYSTDALLCVEGALFGDSDLAVQSDGMSAGTTMFAGSFLNGMPSGQTAISMDGWFKCLNADNAGGVVVQGWDNTGAFNLQFDGTNWLFAYNANGSTQFLTLPSIGDGNWHYVASVWDHGTMTVYIDGVQAAQQGGFPAALDSTTYDVYMIGEGGTYLGYFDEHAIYPVALTSVQVANLYTLGTSFPTPPSPTGGGGFRFFGLD